MNALTPNAARIVTPIPPEAPPRPPHGRLGHPSQVWTYVDAEGRPLVHVCRFDLPARDGSAKPGKEILPLSLWQQPDASREWRWKNLEAPRPLYNLDRIAASRDSDAWIVIAEGEKAADAGGRLFPDRIATTPMNGANAPQKTDWTPLRGRCCLVVADLDPPGQAFRDAVIALLREAGAARILVLDLSGIATTLWRDDREERRAPEDVPKGYDLADAEADGWTAERLQAALAGTPDLLSEDPAFAAPPAAAPPAAAPEAPGSDFISTAEGVWKVVRSYDRKAKETVEEHVRVCGPLEIAEVLVAFDPDAAATLAGTGARLKIPPELARLLARARALEADWLEEGPAGGAAAPDLRGAPSPSADLRQPTVLRRAAFLHVMTSRPPASGLRDALVELRFAQVLARVPESLVTPGEVEALLPGAPIGEGLAGLLARLARTCLAPAGDGAAPGEGPDPVDLFGRFRERAALREWGEGQPRPQAERDALGELAATLALRPGDIVRAWRLVPELAESLKGLTFRTRPHALPEPPSSRGGFGRALRARMGLS